MSASETRCGAPDIREKVHGVGFVRLARRDPVVANQLGRRGAIDIPEQVQAVFSDAGRRCTRDVERGCMRDVETRCMKDVKTRCMKETSRGAA